MLPKPATAAAAAAKNTAGLAKADGSVKKARPKGKAGAAATTDAAACIS